MPDDSLPASSTPSRPENIWQIDWTALGVLVAVEDASGNTTLKRPWLITAVDATGVVRKTHVSVEPIDEAALEELMQLTDNSEGDGLEFQGLSRIWVDNGKQFRSLPFLEKSGIQLVRSSRDHPRGRGRVERIFHDINELLPTMDVPSKVPSTTMTWEEFRAVLDVCIRQYNARHARPDDQADMEAEA